MATTSTRTRKTLRAFPVNRKTAESIRSAIASDDAKAFQKAFLHEIARPLKKLRKQLDKTPLLALWSESVLELNGRERELAASLDELATYTSARHNRKKKGSRAASPFEDILENWLVESSDQLGPWESIVLAEILLRDGQRLSPERFVATLAAVADSTLGETIGGLFEATEPEPSGNDALRQMITAGERLWVCSLLLSPLNGVQTLRKNATESLEKVLTESTDADGTIHGSLLRRLPDWLAPLARCTFWAKVFECELWNESSQQRLSAVTEKVAMLLLPAMHQTSADSPETKSPGLLEIVDFLLPLCESPWESRIQKLLKQCRKPVAAEVSRPRKLKKKEDKDSEDETPDAGKVAKAFEKKKLPASFESDNSCLAVLRSALDADADVAVVEWHSSDVHMQFSAAGVPVFSGSWSWTVRLDDEPVPAPQTWKCSCWFLDPETVFAELEGEESSPIRRVRQMLLAPHDRFAMMTDSVTCQDPSRKIQLVTSVPLTDGSLCTPDAITRELSITVGPRTIRTFPLWMPDDRILSAAGSYRAHDGQLELSGLGKGGVTLPLALDWHPKRTDVAADWAQLTVTESRRMLGGDEASGFRIRIGDHQVMVYRSLKRGENSRAVLGLHTWDETVYTRVPSTFGPLEPLVEVEAPEPPTEE